MKVVRYYGCTKCQQQHWADIEPELFEQHKYWQSKHGIEEKLFINDETADKYIKGIAEIKNKTEESPYPPFIGRGDLTYYD